MKWKQNCEEDLDEEKREKGGFLYLFFDYFQCKGTFDSFEYQQTSLTFHVTEFRGSIGSGIGYCWKSRINKKRRLVEVQL